jgi:hypothetical protein
VFFYGPTDNVVAPKLFSLSPSLPVPLSLSRASKSVTVINYITCTEFPREPKRRQGCRNIDIIAFGLFFAVSAVWSMMIGMRPHEALLSVGLHANGLFYFPFYGSSSGSANENGLMGKRQIRLTRGK